MTAACPVGQCPDTTAASWVAVVALFAVAALIAAIVLAVRARRALRRGVGLAAGLSAGLVVFCLALVGGALMHYGGSQASGDFGSKPSCQAWYVAIENRSHAPSSERDCHRAAKDAILPSVLISVGGLAIVGITTYLILERRRRRNVATLNQFAPAGR